MQRHSDQPVPSVTPYRLPKAGTVGIFSPSEPVTKERLSRLDDNVELLRRLGYRVRRARGYDKKTFYTAGSAADRLEGLHSLLRDERVDLLLASWGGKSTAHLLPMLDYDLFRNRQIPVCGFSDVASLLNAVTARAGLVTFYGPNVAGKLDETTHGDLGPLQAGGFDTGTNLLQGATDFDPIVPGRAEGALFGGNLSTYVSFLSGTDYSPAADPGLFFWESGPKTSQGLDVLLTGLSLAPEIRHLRGMIIGHVEIKDDSKWGNRSLRDIILSIFGRRFPVIHAPSLFGHAALENPPIPIGSHAELDVDAGRLILTSSPLQPKN